MRELVIIGAGGHGRELLDLVLAVNQAAPTWTVLGFLADDEEHPERVAALGYSILGGVDTMRDLRCDYVVGIGNPRARQRLDAIAEAAGGSPVTLRHPTAMVGSNTRLEVGCVLAAQSAVTTNVVLGRSVHVNIGSQVHHDGRLGAYTTLAPGVRLAGNVTTGEGVDVGVGAVVRPGATLGSWSVVGAGAAVVADVPAGVVVVGVPARVLRDA